MMMGRAFGGRLGAALVIGIGLLAAGGCGSSSNGNGNCTTGTTTGGLGGGLGNSMCTMTTGTATCPPSATDTCTICIDRSCCTQLQACAADAACAACGSDATCYEGNQAGLALVTCVGNSCSTQCQ
jgi:hypothetical protein